MIALAEAVRELQDEVLQEMSRAPEDTPQHAALNRAWHTLGDAAVELEDAEELAE